jgi:hypothetical protein
MTTIALIDNHPIIRPRLSLLIKNKLFNVSVLESERIDTLKNLYPGIMPNLIILGSGPSSNINSFKLIA